MHARLDNIARSRYLWLWLIIYELLVVSYGLEVAAYSTKSWKCMQDILEWIFLVKPSAHKEKEGAIEENGYREKGITREG